MNMNGDNDDVRFALFQQTQQQQHRSHHPEKAEQLAAFDEKILQHHEGTSDEEDNGEDEGEEVDECEEDEVSLDEDSEEDEEDQGGDDSKNDTEDDESDKELDQHEHEHDQNKQDSEQNVRLEGDAGNGCRESDNSRGFEEDASLATGIITIPTSSPPPPQQPQQQVSARSTKQQPRLVAVVDSRPTVRDDWSEIATHALLKRWGEKYIQLNRGNLRQEDWEEVALAVGALSKVQKTDVQCKNRLDTLKKKYKLEKQKQSAIVSVDSRWPFYKQLDNLLSVPVKNATIPGAVDAGKAVEDRFDRSRKCDKRNTKSLPDDDSTTSRFKGSPDMTICSSEHDAAGSNDTQSSGRKRKVRDAAPLRTLAKAITKFGEIYEKIEDAKQRQFLDLEKIRMEFTRDLELQRMQLFMQTQVEFAKMKHGGEDHDATVSNLSG